jgi:group I intron endonuclease
MKLDVLKHLNKPEEVHGYIYGFKSPSGKWYIGQTSQKSLHLYISKSYRYLEGESRTKLKRALLKHGFDSFEIFILDICPDHDSLNELEKEYIKFYDSVENGYNCTYGGDCPLFSEDTKLKISIANLGKKKPEGFGEKLRLANLGNKASEESKNKMRLAKLGKKQSKEHIDAKVSAGMKSNGHCRHMYKISSPNGDIFDVINLSKFCKENNLLDSKLSVRGHYKGWSVLSKINIKTGLEESLEVKVSGKKGWIATC